tara:strand:- start:320 stop:613 length:294 start_codon:yes stop_codon:yes gene_type:complete
MLSIIQDIRDDYFKTKITNNWNHASKMSTLLSIIKHSVTAAALLSSRSNLLLSGAEQFVPLCESKVLVQGVSIFFRCNFSRQNVHAPNSRFAYRSGY